MFTNLFSIHVKVASVNHEISDTQEVQDILILIFVMLIHVNDNSELLRGFM